MQHVELFPTFPANGHTLATRINDWMLKNPQWRMVTLHTVQIEKVGGAETQTLVVFEPVETKK